ncbi:uncharacterized protein [Rutidosis leptorrhynchoides]|uniref:uncharacterized protein n=1 Tax=Rutidosis leptorrhynchoides TaxID=125765 RepID=UPI003A997131
MCPPASIPSAIELDEYSTDEVVFKLLTQLKSGGCSLPKNVLSDVDPYQFRPSNLPANIWYFCSGTKMDAENGFWRSTGDACVIYSNTMINGLRETLQFYEGDEQKTNWMMQEYTTTNKCSSKLGLDHGALCRVFLVDDDSSGQLSKSEPPLAMADISPDPEPPLAMTDRSPEPPLAVADRSPEPSLAISDRSPELPLAIADRSEASLAIPDRSPELPIGDYDGDFLELDDLAIPLSRTTSSADSSCMTTSMTSDDFFDLDALMREVENDPTDQENQDSRIKLNLYVPEKTKEVVVQPATLGSLTKDEESKPSPGQTSKTDPTSQNEARDRWNEGTSKGVHSSSPSTSSEGSEKRDRVRRTKKPKIMKFLCFLAF